MWEKLFIFSSAFIICLAIMVIWEVIFQRVKNETDRKSK